ncbi:LysR family transcriptional regulator [Marinobacterium lutimaris]|uniref:Transcriptional regulator, LysR family n=1 Tax=Marinobacterium lutimaris TaxID=568106 RepID=A0A1H6BI69_9GAMM|nr:LysR family transcriptional regulator [Marinobacterium lutimaris]SEG60085.1 transcriptional regulator, LysR family [Marinobacterium lutimaris]
MDDLNDLFFFCAVVKHNGFSAAARAIGVEKTRLSRRVADLEKRLGLRLLRRSTRSMTLTEAGERFYQQCQKVVDDAEQAYESIAELKNEPSGKVKLSCPVILAQSYLAPILSGFMEAYPKVSLLVVATNRQINFIEERFDLALRVTPAIEDSASLVARELGGASRILVASPDFLERNGHPEKPEDLNAQAIISDIQDGEVQWALSTADGHSHTLDLTPRLVTNDLRVQVEAAADGVGIALLPEPIASDALRTGELIHVLPEWSGSRHTIYLVYPRPRGMLPSVRSLIDYLVEEIPKTLDD